MMAEFAATRTGAAQSPAPSSATAQQFEVVSIKPNPNAAGPLVQHAYNVKDFQRLGAPGWIHTERFDSRGSFSGVAMRLSPHVSRPAPRLPLDPAVGSDWVVGGFTSPHPPADAGRPRHTRG